jgi:hypothetical protein
MVRGGTINADESHNVTQSIIATHGRTSKTRHHNRSRKVRRENQQQQALGELKNNAWARTEPPTNDDEDRESDNSDNAIPPGPESSDSESDSGSETTIKKRPMLSQRQSTQERTGRENKKKMPKWQQQN